MKKSDDTPLHELHEPVLRQFATTSMGEITAFSLAIGAVYLSERLMPKQAAVFTEKLAAQLGKWRGTTTEMQMQLAKKILDVSIMNMAGLAGIGVQFGLRRANQADDEKTPFWYEVGRLATGRVLGTITAISALTFMGSKAPSFMKKSQTSIAKQLGGGAGSDRFAELLISNGVQTLGAVAGNAPAQLLYDHLVNPPAKAASK